MRSWSPLALGLAATAIAVAGFVVFVLMFGELPAPGEKLSLNEVGDFFAGLAAPLAFIWLVAAVFLQKDELGAQREQLEQQKEELRLSREQLAAQAAELKLQSKSLQRQEQILSAGEELRLWTFETDKFLKDLVQVIARANYRFVTIEKSLFAYQREAIMRLIDNHQFHELSVFLTQYLQTHQDLQAEHGWTRIPDARAEIDQLAKLIAQSHLPSIASFAEPYKLPALMDELTKFQESRARLG